MGVRCCGLTLSVEGIGWVMREWREEVRLGMMRLLSPWSRVLGRSLVRGRVNDEWALREGAILKWLSDMGPRKVEFSKSISYGIKTVNSSISISPD